MSKLRTCLPVGLPALLLAGAASLVLASCARFAPAPYEDYVGPVRAGAVAPAGARAPAPAKQAPASALVPGAPAPEVPHAAPAPVPAAPQLPASGPVEISVSDAILLTLGNNETFRVERFGPSIAGTFVDELRAAFDPVFSAGISASRTTVTATSATGLVTSTVRTLAENLGLTQFLPTGTTIGLTLAGTQARSTPGGPLSSTGVGLSVTQALLQGFGTDVNLAALRQARIDVETSQYVLRGFAEALVAQTEESYWEYLLAQREIDIFAQSVQLAQSQLDQTQEMIRVGRLAQTELVSAQAELALRQQDLIGGRTALETARLNMVRLINPLGDQPWSRQIVLKDRPAMAQDELGDVEPHVGVALRMRPDLNEARLQVQRGDLDVVKTKNGLLPQLNAFLTLGKSGYSRSFTDSVEDVPGGAGSNVAVGLNFQMPIGNRAPTARHSRAVFNLNQAKAAVDNMAQLVQVDVRSAFVTVVNAREQVTAATATRKLQEEKVKVEQEKLRVGRSTTLLVAQAQDDLLASQISEVQAIIAHMKALTELYRLEGSLLARRGIAAPGGQPVDITRPRQW